MRYIAVLTYLLAMAALATTVVVFAGVHSWSDDATQWAVAVVLGVAIVLELRWMRWRERRSRRRGGREASLHVLK